MTGTNRYIVDLVRSWWKRIPLGYGLLEPVWHRRHRMMLAILWLHVAGLGLSGFAGGHGWIAAALAAIAVAVPALCASLPWCSRRVRSAFTAVAAFAASASVVHLSGGYIESHFHFFVMVAAMALYQDWLPFLVNIVLVILHHGITGILSPAIVYNHPDAIAHPWIWASIHGSFLLLECVALTGAWRVSESASAELQLSEQRVRLLNEVSSVGLFQTDAEGHCVYRNNRCQEIMKQAGVDDSLRHETGFAVLGAEALAVWDQAIRLGREVELECPIGNQCGEITWIHVQTRLIRGRDGAIVGYAGTIQDITARKESEDRIIRLVERLELAASSAQIGVWDWDITTNDLLWDDRMFALYGIRREQFRGAYDAWLSAVHPEDQARCNAAIQQACRKEKPYDIEFRVRWPNGEVRTIKAAGLVIFDAENRPVRMTGVNYDITARKQSEEKLQVYTSELEKSDRWLREAQEIAKVGNWELNLLSNDLIWSDEIFRIFEIDKSRFAASYEAFLEAIHPDDRAMVNEAYLNSLSTRQPYEVNHRLLMADGRIKYVQERCLTHYENDTGRPLRSVGTVQDVTASHLAEIRLAAQYEITKVLAARETPEAAIADAIKVLCESFQWDLGLMWQIDESGEALHYGQAWHRDDGSAADFLGDAVTMTIARGTGLPGRVWQTGKPSWMGLSGGESLFGKDASDRLAWQSALAFPLGGATGETLGVLEFFSRSPYMPDSALLNMLESIGSQIGLFLLKKRTEGELRKSEALFVNVVDHAQDAIIAIDRSQRILLFNRGASRIFKYDQEEAIGKPIDLLLPYFSRQSQSSPAMEQGAGVSQDGRPMNVGTEITGLRKSGEMFPVEASIGSIDLSGEAISSIVLRDISERKQMEELQAQYLESLERAKQSAEEANRAKSEFLANMSHELRTPMHAILSFASLGIDRLERQMPEKVGPYLSRIRSSGTRLLSLLNDLLDLSKLDAGKMTYRIVPQDLVVLVRSAAEQLDPLLQQKRLRLVIRGAEAPVIVSCDGGRILQVLQNLLSNAIKFTPDGKTITVVLSHQLPAERPSISSDTLFVSVSVLDEGVGIPESELETIFHKFVQSSKTKDHAGGTGLGLAICREIVQAHGGEIRASNNPGGGTAVTFTLPKEAADEAVEGA